ncbi:uncharacterized protein VNE69_05040 [Vairimorpha necatrix]|uniref:Uncharacterized protein n=1 Tax=Vairimorpha necatrix TaxID=6039 RepID=A0AAX4JBW9_9MICR
MYFKKKYDRQILKKAVELYKYIDLETFRDKNDTKWPVFTTDRIKFNSFRQGTYLNIYKDKIIQSEVLYEVDNNQIIHEINDIYDFCFEIDNRNLAVIEALYQLIKNTIYVEYLIIRILNNTESGINIFFIFLCKIIKEIITSEKDIIRPKLKNNVTEREMLAKRISRVYIIMIIALRLNEITCEINGKEYTIYKNENISNDE